MSTTLGAAEVVALDRVRGDDVALAGGKGANLGELHRVFIYRRLGVRQRGGFNGWRHGQNDGILDKELVRNPGHPILRHVLCRKESVEISDVA